MVMKLGIKLLNAVRRAYPISAGGKSIVPPKINFSLKNPYVLKALPEGKLSELQVFEGKKLKTVSRVLDSEDYPQILSRYKKITSKKGFSDEELQVLYKKAFPNIKVPTDVNYDAFVFLNNLAPEIGSKFDAHGLAKIGVADQLRQLNTLLSKGIDKNKPFYTALLVAKNSAGAGAGLGTAGGHAYRDGSFIVVGEPSKLIEESGIKHVIVNDAYYNIIDDLGKKFPQIGFVRADEAVEYFTKLLS